LLIPWLTPEVDRRLFAFFFLGILTGGIAVWRGAYARFLFQPAFQRRALIVGEDAMAQQIAAELAAAAEEERANPFRGTGYQVAGMVARLPAEAEAGLDSATSLVNEIRRLGVDEVLVADGTELTPALQEALLDCRELGIPVVPLAVTYERLTARLPVAYAARDVGLIASADDPPARRLYLAGKRLIDVGFGLAGLAVLALLAPAVAVGNALACRGPLFYRQQRVGRGGRPFALVKFRTMVPDAEKLSGAVWAAERDPRVTPVGRWLRRTHLDELPQAINVLRGEMSLVGPRPERPQFVGELAAALPLYRIRHSVRPGITGWAQIRFPYGDSVEDARIKLEYVLYYLKHAGFVLDLLIVLRTAPTMLRLNGH
jgi:exopolysaccharide biosynthesis polyprenyl glycosylphosphotransferase